jgi:D-alanyl-lipoteichoic acid acyltransferase DltB (MBOAT superfamily)
MMPQFASRWNLIKNYKHIILGIFLFSMGLFKKVVIADTFALWVKTGFKADTLNFIDAWATSLSYTFQLYFDFSAYTDMAIGIALLFNIKLPINFNSPYKSLTIQDFWRRWHITLSRFLKDYIYIPLGGNRHGLMHTSINLMATFILGGIWHGAGWTFIFWGFLHGMALVVHRLWRTLGIAIPKILAWFITFNFINIAWVFFRAESWSDAIKVLTAMVDFKSVSFTDVFIDIYNHILEFFSLKTMIVTTDYQQDMQFEYKTLLWIFIIFIVTLKFKNSNELLDYPNFSKTKVLKKRYAVYFALLFMFSLLYQSLHEYSEFIYFNF